jgi:hypothetical protein
MLHEYASFYEHLYICDFLFIYSSDSHEIGGLKTGGKLARDLLSSEPWRINGFSLHHDPTTKNKDKFFVAGVDSNSIIKNVVACGSDTVEEALEISKKFNSKKQKAQNFEYHKKILLPYVLKFLISELSSINIKTSIFTT